MIKSTRLAGYFVVVRENKDGTPSKMLLTKAEFMIGCAKSREEAEIRRKNMQEMNHRAYTIMPYEDWVDHINGRSI